MFDIDPLPHRSIYPTRWNSVKSLVAKHFNRKVEGFEFDVDLFAAPLVEDSTAHRGTIGQTSVRVQ